MPTEFDEAASAGDLVAIARQLPHLTTALSDTYDRHQGHIGQAAADPKLLRSWDQAAPETRAAILLSLAWGSRAAQLRGGDTTAGRFAAALHHHAVTFTGTTDEFHGARFPIMPLPGPAGALASSIAFARDETDISLALVLILLDGVRQAG